MTICKLNATIIKDNNKLILYGKKSFELKLDSNSTRIESFLADLKHGISHIELCNNKKFHPFNSLLKFLFDRDLLVFTNTDYKDTILEKTYDFFCHHLSNREQSIFNFNRSNHIAIVGCGGIGSNIAINLITAGFYNFTVVDSDKVEISNLNRQYPYTNEDVGNYKVDSLAQKLKTLQPQAKVITFIKKINSSTCLNILSSDVNILVSGIDNPIIKSAIYTTKYALKQNIPIMFGSVGYDNYKVGPFLVSDISKKNYISHLKKLNTVTASPITGSLGAANSLLTSMMSMHIINYFYAFKNNVIKNSEIIYDLFNFCTIAMNNYDC